MSNRFALISIIVVAVLVGGFVLFVIGLFMMPGLYLFGVKYIASNTHNRELKNIDIEQGRTISGIVLNTYEIPIKVEITSGTSCMITYIDNYNGITTSSYDDPLDLKMEYRDDNVLVITTGEFETFIYEGSVSDRCFHLKIPFNKLQSSNRFSLEINSKKSNINFFREELTRTDNPKIEFENLTLNTNGKITVDDSLKDNGFINVTDTFTQKTSDSIKINDETNIVAKNYKLESTAGSITIEKGITGDLDLTTVRGNIKFVYCQNLVVNTIGGNISYAESKKDSEEIASQKGKINIYGSVNIVSKTGNIEIGRIEGFDITNHIETTSGNISIDYIRKGGWQVDGKEEWGIYTEKGTVYVAEAGSVRIYSEICSVQVDKVVSDIEVKTKWGNIILGGKLNDKKEWVANGNTINDPTVSTELGQQVKLFGTTGNVSVDIPESNTTIKPNIYIQNSSSELVTLDCNGENLTAVGLMGIVDIKSNSKVVDLSFSSITGQVIIDLGDNCKNANVTLPVGISFDDKGKTDDIAYYFDVKHTILFDGNGNSQIYDKSGSLDNITDDLPRLKITGKNVELKVLFRKG